MSEPKTVEQAQTSVKKILDILQVARVVCVDDEYGDEPSVEDVVVAACNLDAETLKKVFPEIGDFIPDDQDILQERIRRLWSQIDQKVRSDRSKSILAAGKHRPDTEADDLRDATILSELIPKEMLITLSPNQWEERCSRLIEEDDTQRTLFLFDQDLSKNGGDVDGGTKIISSLLARANTGNLICGLLTHTVTPENQQKKWLELSHAYSIPCDRFLVVPKQYLNRNPVYFAQLLKLVALSPDFTRLKQKTMEIIKNAASTAAGDIDDITIYDLDHMVFKISDKEGLWEPDMLFRLHTLFHRLESRRLAHEGGVLEEIASRLRSVSHIPTDTTLMPFSTTWKIQNRELYELGEYLNENHLPLELGDIFEKVGTGSKKCYILLAQPCDLMVRKNGKREPELGHVTLAEITSFAKPPRYAEEMAYFGNDPNVRWYVKLKQVRQVCASLLDLCVFNDDGVATIHVNGGAPNAIRPAWKARYAILSKLAERLLKRLDMFSPVEGEPKNVKQIKVNLMMELASELLNEGLFKGKLIDHNGRRGIAYNCRRVGRVSRARAFGLLMAYTGFLSRPAYDVPLDDSCGV